MSQTDSQKTMSIVSTQSPLAQYLYEGDALGVIFSVWLIETYDILRDS